MRGDPTIDELAKKIARYPREAVLWTRSGIPSSGGDCTSYFGGLPRLPPSMEWPRLTMASPVDGLRFLGSPTFLGQLDFADIDPPFARAQRLPTKGVVYFFCGTAFVDGEPGYRVLFAPEGCAEYGERAPPIDLMRLAGHPYCSGRDWRRDDEAWSKVDFRYALKAQVFESYRGWHEWPNEEEWKYKEAYDRVQIAALEHALGPLTRFTYPKDTKEWADQQAWVRRLFPSWPISRLFFEEFRRALEHELDGGDGRGLYKPPTEASGPVSVRFYEQTKADLTHWSSQLGGRDMFEPLPDALREDLRNWFLAMRARSHELNYGAAKAYAIQPFAISQMRDESMWLAANITMAHGEIGGLDGQAIRAALQERVESWKTPIRETQPVGMRDLSRPMHQTLGYGEQCQSAAEDHVNDVLLFKIANNDCLGWQGRYSEMLLQFWIKPQDLAAKRFDRVEMTAECD